MEPNRRMGTKLPVAGVVATVLAGCLAGALEGQALTAGQRAAIDSLARTPIEEGRAAGMSLAVVRGSDTLALAAYGSADLELGVETPEDAVYEIGSVTKQFTAAAILLLEEDGKLSLDDDLTTYLPDYPTGGRSIPVRRLLNHTSGIMGYTEMPAFQRMAVLDLPRDSLVALFSAEPFVFEPGEALIYNNSAYFLLGLIIEEVTGGSYEDFVETRLFEPAGMADSRYCHKDELTPRRAKGYQPGSDGLRPADYLDHRWPYAAGSLCSTVRDLVRWNQALHGDGEGGTLLSPDSYRELITPGTLADGTPIRYAKGVGITHRDGRMRIAHGGGIFGYLSEVRYFPDDDLSIVVLINTAGPTSPGAIASAVEDVVLGPATVQRPRAFSGSLDAFTGVFRGAGRGRRLNVTVGVEDGALQVRMPPAPEMTLEWLGGDTFGAGQTRFTFDGDALHIDQVGGHYVLQRVER